ncbi:MAG: glycosyltransferase family 4 protein, partial [Chloroflexi bacterium]|nr:glycosyltransferase family 4 protein [Chloroflexota bacterium]
AGHQVTVYTSNVPPSARRAGDHGVHVNRFRSWFGPLNNQFVPGLFLRLLGRNRYDVVHVHSHVFLSSNMAALSRCFNRLPMVLTSHGAIPGYGGWKRGMEIVYNATAGNWTLKAMNRVIALSPTQADILQGLGARRRDIRIIPPGIELSRFHLDGDSRTFRSRYGIGDRKTVLFVGTLIPRKGVEYLIEALRYTTSKPLLLLVGGEIPGFAGHQEFLKQRAVEAGVDKDVLFLGHFTRDELEPAYLATDVFALPSFIEGLPIVVMEAMAYGKGIVATDIPGNCDAIQDGANGLLCTPGDPRDLAQKIDLLLASPELRAKLGARARRDALANYGWDSVLARITGVYEEVAEDRDNDRDRGHPT